MATVHPSRLGLVPRASPLRDQERYNDRDGYRDKERDIDDPRSRRGDSRDLGRGGNTKGWSRGRSPSPPPDRSRAYNDDRREERLRRRSPDYSSYRREEPPHVAAAIGDANASGAGASAPWHAPENMYASRGRSGYGASGGEDYFASRRLERASKQVNIWPPSPKEPSGDIDKPGSKKKRSSKRHRSTSVTSSSEDERERRRRKEKKRNEKAKDRNKKHRRDKAYDDDSDDNLRDGHRKHHREKLYNDDDSKDDRRRRRRRDRSRRSSDSDGHESPSRSRSRSRSKSHKRRENSRHKSRHSSRADTPPRSHAEEGEAEWVEKPADSFVAVAEHTGKEPHMDTTTKGEKNAMEDSDSEEVGPQPVTRMTNAGKKVDERTYGGALLRGEGSAMAAFLQGGNTEARIPRRGEIGLTSEEIASFESVGYVMSGSRHRRMNAVRMRKENQVISAEEKRGILKLQREERERREAILRDEFRGLVEDNLKGAAGGADALPATQEEDA